MEVHDQPIAAGGAVSASITMLLNRAWRHLPELQNRPQPEYLHASVHLIQLYDRIEITAYSESEVVAGGGILIELEDIHYGTVACLMHCFGEPGAGAAVLARAIRIAKARGYKWFCRSSRVSATEYRQLYRRL